MPKKTGKQKDKPELFARVFKIINGIKDERGFTASQISKEIHAKLEQMSLNPKSRNVLLQVRRALKFGTENKLFVHKCGKYYLASSVPSNPKKKTPYDSMDLMNLRKTKTESNKRESEAKLVRKKDSLINKRGRPAKSSSRIQNLVKKQYHLSRDKNCCADKSCCADKTCAECIRSLESSLSNEISQKIVDSIDDTITTENLNLDSSDDNAIRTQLSVDIKNDNKLDIADKCKYSRQSKINKKGRGHSSSSFHSSIPNSGERKIAKTKKKKIKSTQEIIRNRADNVMSGLSTTTALAAAIMIMISLWYGYR